MYLARNNDHSGTALLQQKWPNIRRLAFSSCTAYDMRPQPIWTEGVIPASPDAWIWLGDLAYMDDPLVDCRLVPHFPECNCTADWMRRPPFSCNAGSPQHARMRVQRQLSVPEYQAFLGFMCPNFPQWGVYPPAGSDPVKCPRPIFGTYDDHDSGWNNGNGRNPAKHEIKNIYLDAIGEPQDSARRSSADGLQTSYVLPGPGTGSSSADGDALVEEILLVLLDERYHRETLPCSSRQKMCQDVLRGAAAATAVPGSSSPDAGDVAWCQDYLGSGQPGSLGSCCRKDDEWLMWCKQPGSQTSQYFAELCDPTSSAFAQQQLVLAPDNVTALPLDGAMFSNSTTLPLMYHRLLEAASSPICEVLGLQQRRWLQQTLHDSKAALKIVASGSVLAGNPVFKDRFGQTCSGDDWDCWPRAQADLLHELGNVSGCVVIITGDYHYSDLKVIEPGSDSGYADVLQTHGLNKRVYQVMASGMSSSTADGKASNPCSSFREDTLGLRPLGRCSFVSDPGFGMIEVDWEGHQFTINLFNTGVRMWNLDIAEHRVCLRAQ
eukprot:gene9939-10094_t